MENHLHDQTKILSTKISCCEDCPKILEDKLLKMPGVDSVAIDREKNLVLVTGKIDAMTLVNNVAKLGKKVKLLPTYKHPYNKTNHFEEKHKEGYNFNCSNKDYSTAAQEKAKLHKNCCCSQNHHKKKEKKAVEEEEEHKCEAYVPAKYDKRICRDFYCEVHPQSYKIVDRVPAESPNWFGGLPFYANFGRGNPYGGSYRYPGWYGEEPPRFGYHQRPRMLHHPFGFQ